MPVCFINVSRYGPNVPASLSPAMYSTALLDAVGTVFSFGFNTVVVVDVVDVEAGVIGARPSLTTSDVLGAVGAACVCWLGPPNTAETTEYTKKRTATTAIPATTRRAV
jgi:hypothetical protein